MIEGKIKQKLLFSFFGYALPLFIAVLTIPWLVTNLGEEAFGLLTLGWILVGFASVFDLGLGRALTKYISEQVSQAIFSSLWPQVRFVFKFMLASSLVILFFSELASHWLIHDVLVLSDDFKNDALTAMMVLLLSIPLVVISNLFIAVLEGTGQVKSVALVRSIMGSLMFLLPLLAWQMSLGMLGVMMSLLLARLVALLGYALFARTSLLAWYSMRMPVSSSQHWLLLKSGGWMSVSTVLAPVLTTTDRFIIGAILSVSLVTYYSTPVDMLMKLQVFSAALMAVVFPAFAASYLSNTHRTQVLFTKSAWLLGVVMFLIALLTVLFGQQVLSLWLDEAFAQQSKWVLYWAAIGLFVNALSFVPFALLQAIGRADITAKINLIELPFYFVVLFFALAQWGIVGAAIASTLRLTINAFLLFFYSGHFYVQVRKQSRIVSLLMLIGLSVLLLLLRYH